MDTEKGTTETSQQRKQAAMGHADRCDQTRWPACKIAEIIVRYQEGQALAAIAEAMKAVPSAGEPPRRAQGIGRAGCTDMPAGMGDCASGVEDGDMERYRWQRPDSLIERG